VIRAAMLSEEQQASPALHRPPRRQGSAWQGRQVRRRSDNRESAVTGRFVSPEVRGDARKNSLRQEGQ
jgi:hypothetical protein